MAIKKRAIQSPARSTKKTSKVTKKKLTKKTVLKKASKKPESKKIIKKANKGAASKKVAKKKSSKTAIKLKPVKKTAKKKSTKASIKKKVVKAKVKIKKASKKPVEKPKKTFSAKSKPIAKKSKVKPTAKKQTAKPISKKKLTPEIKAEAKSTTNKTKPKKTPSNPGKPNQSNQVSLKEVTAISSTQEQRMIPENIHPPTMPVDSSPEEFTTPTDLRTTAGAVDFSPLIEEPGETYMCERQKKHFYNILSKWKNQLMSEVDTTVVHMKQEALSLPDPLDRATQEEGFNLELRTRDRERKLIKKIEQSLDDIDKGVYGYCEECGVDIGIRRLEARPTADKCIDCKTFSEIRERQEGLS